MRTSSHSLESCKAPGLPPKNEPEPEIVPTVRKIIKKTIKKTIKKEKVDPCAEVFKSLSTEEEETHKSSFEMMLNWVELDKILNELTVFKQRVRQINKNMLLGVPACPDIDPCRDVGQELFLMGRQPELLVLHKNTYMLGQQQAEIQLIQAAGKQVMNCLGDAVQRQRNVASGLLINLRKLKHFRRNIEKEQVLCIQRYRHLEEVKLGLPHDSFSKTIIANLNKSCESIYALSKLVSIKEYICNKSRCRMLIKALKEDVRHLTQDVYDERPRHLDYHYGLISFIKTIKNISKNFPNERHSTEHINHLLGILDLLKNTRVK